MSKMTRNRGYRQRRRGALLSAELIIVLPLLIGVALAIVQFILISTANYRVEVAAVEGARQAARGRGMNRVYEAVGIVLSPHLSGAYEVEVEYFDENHNGEADRDDDFVVVSVRIPMANVGHNWLGFLGGSVDDLCIRSVVKLPIEESIPFLLPPNADA